MLGVKLQALVYDIGGRCRKAMLGVKLQALVYDIGGRCRKAMLGVRLGVKLQALVYDIGRRCRKAALECDCKPLSLSRAASGLVPAQVVMFH